MRIPHIVVLLLLSVALTGCEKREAASSSAGSVSSSKASSNCDPSQPGATCPGQASPTVAKIVFVGKEHACDCIRKSVDAGWAALQKALGTPSKVPVERLQIDTEPAKVAPYRRLRPPMMALPAIYFLDGKGGVVELLQGEVSEADILRVLEAAGTTR